MRSNAFEDPPQELKDVFKKSRKAGLVESEPETRTIDADDLRFIREIRPQEAFRTFLSLDTCETSAEPVSIFESIAIPGQLSFFFILARRGSICQLMGDAMYESPGINSNIFQPNHFERC